MFEEIFLRKRLLPERLSAYGFAEKAGFWELERDILGGDFRLTVSIRRNGEADTRLIERDTGEEYSLYKTEAAGSFVGEVRSAVGEVLSDIVLLCYEPSAFRSEEVRILTDYVRCTYGDELEFLWEKFPDNAIWRRRDNGKWYAAILTVRGDKLGLDTDKTVEIIDLRMAKENREATLSSKGCYPGWHMNKQSWYTVILNGEMPEKELIARLDESYRLAGK